MSEVTAIRDDLKEYLAKLTERIERGELRGEPLVESPLSEAERWTKLAPAIGVPARHRAASFEAGRPMVALERVRQFVQDGEAAEGKCLLLCGSTGSGTTYAATAGLRGWKGPRRFWYFPALAGALLSPSTRDATLHEVKETGLLVLDDFGVEFQKADGLVEVFLDEIIWTREAEYRATILTTNLSLEALRERLSSRILDRLRGDWGIVYVIGDTASLRVNGMPLTAACN